MNIPKKNKKHGRLYKTLLDFGENTSFHGVKYAVSSESTTCEKVFWILVVILCFIGSIYMTMIFWSRFTSNPIRISILPVKKQTSIISFPGITICTGVKYLPEKVERFISTLNIPENTTTAKELQNSFKSLMAYIHEVDVVPEDIDLLNEILSLNNYTEENSIGEIFSLIEPDCEDILIKCRWEQEIISCPKYFKPTLTHDGQCCSFNTNFHKKEFQTVHTLFYGPQMGLSIILDPKTSAIPNSLSVTSSTGIKIFIHDPDDYPSFGSVERNLANGTETFIRIVGTRLTSSDTVKALTPEQRNCFFEDEENLEYFPIYKDTNCDVECKMNDNYHFCKCIPFHFPKTKKRICELKDISCLSDNFNAIYRRIPSENSSKTNLPCDNCRAQCNDVFYYVQTTNIPIDHNVPTVSNFYDIDEKYKQIQDRMVIHIYFGSFYQTEMLRDTITSYYYLLSSFGGVFSLFLGCSFLSVLEILYFFCYKLFIK